MEPPLKRPRLSMFADEPDNAELERARVQNDLLLKNSFEAIFAKYSEDFAGIGDEIDLNTGEVVVNNGHLDTLKNEKDTGKSNGRSTSPKDAKSVATGQSMLRAMTVAPDRDDSYFEDESADDVIASIETIAGVIDISSDEDDESDEDIEMGEDSPSTDDNCVGNSSELDARSLQAMDAIHGTPTLQDRVPSDTDSLFEVKQEYRDTSPDSLFEVETPPTTLSVKQDPAIKRDPEAQEIIAKFGENVGREVLNLLAQRDKVEKHIEPAWRIPVKPANLSNPHSSSVPLLDGTADRPVEVLDLVDSTGSPDEVSTATPRQMTPSPNKGVSLWKKPARRSKTQIRRDRIWQRVREESEDPLQDGFNSADSSAFEEDPDEEADLERCSRIIKRGICPWCKEEYAGQDRVLQHLRRVIRKHNEGKKAPGDHNVDHIAKVRPKIMEIGKARGRGSRPSRMIVSDLKTMVELHEAGGYGFDYIIAERFLHTKNKDVEKLRELYEKFRSSEDDEEDTYTEPWTRREEALVAELASNPFRTMDTLRRRLKTRSDREIGGYLARKWLQECRGDVDIKYEIEERKIAPQPSDEDAEHEPDDLFQIGKREEFDREIEDELFRTRQPEESDDDLFVGPSFPASESASAAFIKQEIGDSEVDELFG